MAFENVAIEDAGGRGHLHPVVDAGDLGGVHQPRAVHRVPALAREFQHIGQVQLVLGVGGGEAADHGAQHGRVENVDAGVDLGERGLLGRRVGVFDDLEHVAVGVADDAAVAVRVLGLEGQHRHRRALRIAAVLGQQRRQRVTVEQRHVGGGDQQIAGEVGGQRRQRAPHRVPGAQLLLLHRGVISRPSSAATEFIAAPT